MERSLRRCRLLGVEKFPLSLSASDRTDRRSSINRREAVTVTSFLVTVYSFCLSAALLCSGVLEAESRELHVFRETPVNMAGS